MNWLIELWDALGSNFLWGQGESRRKCKSPRVWNSPDPWSLSFWTNSRWLSTGITRHSRGRQASQQKTHAYAFSEWIYMMGGMTCILMDLIGQNDLAKAHNMARNPPISNQYQMLVPVFHVTFYYDWRHSWLVMLHLALTRSWSLLWWSWEPILRPIRRAFPKMRSYF